MRFTRIVICISIILVLFSVPVGAEDVEYVVKGEENIKDSYEIKEEYNFNEQKYYVVNINESAVEKSGSMISTNDNIVRNNIVTAHDMNDKKDRRLTFNLEMVNAEKVPNKEDYEDVNIAVLDTGISEHENLNSVEWESNTISSDNGTVEDNNGHGTHVAGIIAAEYNPSNNVRGVAPGIGLYDIKVLDKNGTGDLSDVATGIRRAAEGPDGKMGTEDDADVISMSMGSSSDYLIRDMIENVYPETIVVASSGNNGDIEYPAKLKETVAVSNLNKNADPFPFANAFGEENTVAAPGVAIKSLDNNGGFTEKTGTSMSAPHVSGALGIYLSKYDTDAHETKEILEKTSTDIYDDGFDTATGHGLLDVKNLSNPEPKIKSVHINDNKYLRISFEAITFDTRTNIHGIVETPHNTQEYNIGCCEFILDKDGLKQNGSLPESIVIKIKAENKWGSDLKSITYNLKDREENIVRAIRRAGNNPNTIERQSLQDAVFKFVEGNGEFRGLELTRDGIEDAVFEYVTV